MTRRTTTVVYVINGTASRRATGPGPGPCRWDEAKWLCARELAVWGTSPPMGMYGAGSGIRRTDDGLSGARRLERARPPEPAPGPSPVTWWRCS